MAKKSAAAKKAGEQYEAMFLFPAGAAAEIDGSIKAARGIIERHGGKIMVIKKWDERKLAYEMARQKRGVYIIAFFTAPGAAVAAIERDVNLSEDILRVLVTKAEHLNETEMAAVEPQPIVPREPNPGFGGFGGGFGGGGFGGGGFGGGGYGGDDRGPRRPRPEPEAAGTGKE